MVAPLLDGVTQIRGIPLARDNRNHAHTSNSVYTVAVRVSHSLAQRSAESYRVAERRAQVSLVSATHNTDAQRDNKVSNYLRVNYNSL